MPGTDIERGRNTEIEQSSQQTHRYGSPIRSGGMSFQTVLPAFNERSLSRLSGLPAGQPIPKAESRSISRAVRKARKETLKQARKQSMDLSLIHI